MKILKAKIPILIHGQTVEIGETFSCTEVFAEKLIASKSAETMEVVEKTIEGKPFSDRQTELETLSKAELLNYITAQNIEGLSDKNKKDELIAAILENEL